MTTTADTTSGYIKRRTSVEEITAWVIYDHPTDFPDHFVARKYLYDAPTQDMLQSENLNHLREEMHKLGLVCIPRSPSDDAKIVETWI